MATRNLAAQEWIFREGEEANHCYIVQSGKVQLTRNTGQGNGVIATINAGECFGEIAVLENLAHYGCSAVAAEPTVVESLTLDEFHKLIEQSPPILLPLFEMAFEQLKRVSLRAATATTAQVRLDNISKVSLRAADAVLSQAIPQEIPINLNRLPFKIGGYPEGGEIANSDNNLNIPCRANPLAISRQHCQIDIVGEHLMVMDLGSRFNTVVNGTVLGRGRGIYKAPLAPGANTVVLGGTDLPYTITIDVA
jgi:hypothetical protein